MLVNLLKIIILFSEVVAQEAPTGAVICKRSTDAFCDEWGPCSCDGIRSRACGCITTDFIQTEHCDKTCKHGRLDSSGCVCPEWRYGACCEGCRHIHIDHCVDGKQACRESPDSIQCTQCYDPYYPAGYGIGCKECGAISHCIKRNCTAPSNTKCQECENNNVFFKLTTSNTKCERLCSFNNHTCWPGHCSEGFAKNCACTKGFRLVLTETETSCQPTQTPEIETCNTVAIGLSGEKRMANSSNSSKACKYLKDIYGNYQLKQFSAEMVSSFLLDVSAVTKPIFIREEHFGITDTIIYIEKKLINGVNTRLSAHHQLNDTSDSTKANKSYKSRGNFSVNHNLTNGEALCVVFEAYGGGYLKHVNTIPEPDKVSSPVPYQKSKGSKEICYRFDSAKPEHCLALSSCHKEPISLNSRVTRSQISTVSFDGWLDPTPVGGKNVQASGIESYEVTVNEVLQANESLMVDMEHVFNKKINESASVLSFSLKLPSDMPRLYSITLEVKDFADNTRQARRFLLYDNTSFIESWPEKHFRVTSASKQSNFTWQNHHHNICLSWNDYFQNRFYMENKLLNPIEPGPFGQISGVYEQLSGTLAVSGTPNVYGIIKFLFSSSLNGGKFSAETEVPNFLNQSYCNDFKVKDGQTYTLQVRPIDIANNSFSENRTVHVDRSVPHINNIWLIKDGYHTLFVHHMTELSTMQLYFEALDPHSGIRNVEWTFGITDLGTELTKGAIGIKTIPDPSCPKNILECYCPDVGKCEFFNYTIPLNKLIEINKHKGNHNRNYYFTVKITNHAFLTNKERVDILVDESPPEPGVIYEGPKESKDIDYISDNSFMAHWHGFVDHESGIKSYRIGLAQRCLGQLELYNFTTVPVNMFYAEVPFTETSIRIPANFTGKRYVSIIALNNAMEPSKSVCSDGVSRDLSPPQLRNVTLEHASWSERVICHNGEAWHFLSSLSKVRLPDTSSCVKLCAQNSSGSENNEISEMLPTKVVTKRDRDTSEFMCRNLQTFSKDTVVYLPNDHIDLRWDIDENVSQLEDFYVGIGTHPSEVNLPSIYGYQSTARRKTFSHYHKGISSNDLFYIFIKVVNKAGLEKISILGPILIDETPPLKQRLPEIIVTDDEIVIGWENDTFYDMEQSEQISSMFFQFGHDGNVVTPLLHWQLHVSEPCPRFSGGCLKYPLTRLQSFDTDLGFLFYADVYVYNNAGHALKVTTDTFRLPSRYPPGHAIVYDVDPELEGNLDDTDIHFTPETMCFRSSGFKHHQSISIEIGVSSGNMSDDIVPLTATNVSNTYCLNSTNITFDTTYYAIVRASCSGGVTTSFSNGVKILSEDYLIKNIKVELGQDCSKRSSSLLVPSIQNSSSEITFTFSVSVGMPYIVNVPFNNTFVLSTNDGILANDSRKGRHLSFISFNENPTITISSWSKEYTNTDIHLCLFTEYQNNKRKSVHWYYQGINSSFGLTYEYAFISYVDNFLNNSVKYIIPFIKKENGLTTSISGVDLEMNETYKWAVRQCSKVRCLQPVYSMAFHVDKIKPVGNILTSIMDVTNDAGCSKVTLEWVPFQGGSKIKFYQWVISKDANANLLLTPWKTIIAKDSRLHKVSSCVVLPVYHYSTMFMCVRAFAESGNWGHVCEILSFRSLGRNARNPVYEFDVHSDIWETVLQALSSSNLGKIYTDFHDNELNFGTTSTKAAGVILYANERNVTWYLMLSKLVPDNCDQSKDCETSKITSSGYVVFSQDSIKPNTIYYICAFSNVTVFEREYFSETMDEINSCSNGFVVDTVAPKVGKVYVHSKEGYLTNFEGIEVTWDGFIENVDAVQLGYVDRIKRYSFAIGSRPKQDDIRNYTDVSLVKRIVLNDIKVTDGSVIYFSVKAEDHAGLTCIAVSKQYITDTTPPVLGTISNTRDDIYQSTESYITSNTVTVSVDRFRDDESGIDFFEIGVGTRPYFSDVILFSRYDENNVVLHIGDTDLIDGHTYYLIARAVNHAGLTSPLAQMKMTVDRSPPTGGHVMEGHWALKNGTDYQSDVSRIHGHWKGFDDVHSGILYYRVGLGTQQYHDDIEPMVDVGLTEDLTWNDHFYVGQKYYITVEACNGAGLCQTRSSNGIVLDNSPPIRGLVRIGSNLLHQKYQAHLSSVHVHWAGFEDPQSGIDHYTMCVGEKKGKCNIFPEFSCLLHTNIIKTGLNLPQRTDLFATVTAYNKVGMNVSKTSDAFRVDATAPVLMIKPTFHLVDGIMGQWEKSVLRIYWNFNDQESPIVSHDVSLFTHHEGHTPVEQLHLGPENKLTINLNGKEWLHDGDRYIALVTSCNQAGLCTSASSDDLLIDSTPPHSGGFKQPMLWANLNDSQANSKSKVTLTWYGFFDQESGIRNYFLTVSRSYSGNELTDGVITFLPEKNMSEHVHYLYLRDVIHGNDLLFLTIWAENNVGLNSSVARVSVNALPSSKSVNVYEMKGSMELEKHSCDIHFCNKDCTCAVVGKPCVEVSTNKSCKEVNGKLEESGYPSYKVLGGLNEIPSYISASSACLSGRWNIQEQDNSSFAVKRFEWSAGIVDQPIGEGVYNLKLENPWQDIGVRNRFVHCLSTNKSLLHSHEYVIYVRAWYSFDKYAVFESDPIMIDQTAPAVSRGRAVLDSNEMCTSDFDIIDWMDTITACWNAGTRPNNIL